MKAIASHGLEDFRLEDLLRFFRRKAQSLSNHDLCFLGFFLGHATLREREHVSISILVNCSVAKSITSQSGLKSVSSKFDKRKRMSSCLNTFRKISAED